MANSIAFPFYPTSNRTYGVFADVDGSKANTAQFQQRALLVGQMLPAGTAVPNVAVLITSAPQAGALFGVPSMLYEMVKQYYLSDTFGELWAAPVSDPTGSVATATITFVGTTIGIGTVALYIAGVSIPVPVQVGDTVTTIATRCASLINANTDVPVSATAVAGVVTVTSDHKGLLLNDIDIRLNYLGPLGGEFPVSGLTVTPTVMVGGSGTPVLSTLLANLGEVTYDFIGHPFADTASLSAFDSFFNFSTGRWSWQSMLYGGYFTAIRGTPGTLVTFGQSRNGPNGSCLGFFDSPDPCWKVAADYCANCAVSLRADPNTPLQNIILNFKAPPPTSSFVRSVRNTLLYDGISTYTVNRAGQVVLERAITFYQLNTAGAPDTAYLDVETLFGTALLIRDWQVEMERLFPRAKLFEDGNAIPAGSNVTTAAQIRLATIAWYRNEAAAGNAQNPDQFASEVLAQNAGNGLVSELLPFILPQQLRQIAGVVQFTKP